MLSNLHPGDVIIIWGSGWSRIISWLIYLVFGIRNPASHAEMVYNSKLDISAEAGGVVLKERSGFTKQRGYVLARNQRIANYDPDFLRMIMNRYVGKKYDYALYIIWYLRISIVFLPFVWFIFQPLRNWLKREESKRFTCSELVAELLKRFHILTGISDPSNAAPDTVLQSIRACSDWEIIEVSGKTNFYASKELR